MNCDRCQSQIDDPEAKAAVDAHLSGCSGCRRFAEDLRAIRSAAASVERHVPPAQAWTRIAAAIAADNAQPALLRRLSRLLGTQPALPGPLRLAAGAFAMALILGVGWMAWRDLRPGAASGVVAGGVAGGAGDTAAADADGMPTVNDEIQLAENAYVKEIERLEGDFQSQQAQLDPDAADVVNANLSVVDQAIGESRAARQAQPQNEVAQDTLFEAMRRKVELLQDAIALVNEMRQGNTAGAARIVSGQNP